MRKADSEVTEPIGVRRVTVPASVDMVNVLGPRDEFLRILERDLAADVHVRGNEVTFTGTGENRVRVSGASGRPRPDQLKVSLGFRGGWLGEGQISYAGPRALDRARLAADVVRERLVRVHGVDESAIRVEYIGAGAAFRGLVVDPQPFEVRLRVSARVPEPDQAEVIGWEVESLYTNGPAAGGGVTRTTRETVVVRSCLLPRRLVTPFVHLLEA